jgi:hypothetical protein
MESPQPEDPQQLVSESASEGSVEKQKVCHEPVAVQNLSGIIAAHNMSTARRCLTMNGKPPRNRKNRPIPLRQVDWCISPDPSY